MKKTLLAVIMAGATALLSACTSPAQRMAECERQGISKDTCYLAEQNRQNAYNEAAQNAAWANARDAAAGKGIWAKKDAKQHAQAAKATHAFKWEKMTITIRGEILDVDGVLGALDENEPQAKVYSQGLYTFIYYPVKGKLAVSKEGQFQGYARKIK
ncbi:hypothetical protein [Enterobacter asburiae]|uniref:hypothetical protein n=1 Tax=Enterobacter asburiae TaxID=61645 RepID=UPI00187F65F4|nr:hypothetical protein [Enterobacter asburiae]MBE8905363.1 hypothetical protein [Enterobacter asburiae]